MPLSTQPPAGERRSGHNLLVFLAGLALTAGFYTAVETYAAKDSLLVRYCCAHPIEYVEVGMFFWGLAALGAKAWNLRRQRAALRSRMLPEWAGQPVPVAEAGNLLAGLTQLPHRLHDSLLGRRLRGGLEFVCSRGSTDGLDEHLRSQSDADADAVDGSYSLIRFITWAIPILGFLGTVLGITEAIANVTPEQLAKSISGVTDGLALAFDTTAIALGFSMALMFFSFVMERGEAGVLRAIDDRAEQQLAHRFERLDSGSSEVVTLLRQNTQTLFQAVERLVHRQSELWSKSMEAMRERFEHAEEQHCDQLAAGLRRLLDKTIEAHERRLTAMEQEALGELLHRVDRISQELRDTGILFESQANRAAEQFALQGQLLDSEKQILRLQETLGQNLQALAQAGTFQQAIHSLTAAIQLLVGRVEGSAPAVNLRTTPRQGNAA